MTTRPATFAPRFRLKWLSVLASGLLLAASVSAQDKPPLKIVTGFPPGGSVDILARIIADAMRDDFSNVVVENKPGAAGRIALNQVKLAKPDGQTVVILPMGPMVLFPHTFKKLDYDGFKDFTPVSQLALSNFALVAGPSSGVMMEQSIGVPLNHVPFQGGAPANTALLGGHIQYNIDVVAEALPLHRDGKVKILAVLGAERDPLLPNVQTLKEQGVNLESAVWFAMYAPAGLAPDVLMRLEKAVSASLRKPDVREKLAKLGYVPTGSSSRELASIHRADFARWEKPIKATGISLD